ncbi:hypothetical protein BDZ91DRAFT_731923 [Kalaharituber pfeilii]|nr:hypothetical protein BDZ91DRAFT_731923 [Kalaharituber pfeilii]
MLGLAGSLHPPCPASHRSTVVLLLLHSALSPIFADSGVGGRRRGLFLYANFSGILLWKRAGRGGSFFVWRRRKGVVYVYCRGCQARM